MKYEYINDYTIRPENHLNLDWSGANGFCFDESGRVCVVWEKEKGYWTLPGGGREDREIPEETFVREVNEESQCDAVGVEYLHCVYAKCLDENGVEVKVPENRICFRYICKLKNIQDFVPNKNGHEIDERRFVNLDELPNYITWLKDTENGANSFKRLKKIAESRIRANKNDTKGTLTNVLQDAYCDYLIYKFIKQNNLNLPSFLLGRCEFNFAHSFIIGIKKILDENFKGHSAHNLVGFLKQWEEFKSRNLLVLNKLDILRDKEAAHLDYDYTDNIRKIGKLTIKEMDNFWEEIFILFSKDPLYVFSTSGTWDSYRNDAERFINTMMENYKV